MNNSKQEKGGDMIKDLITYNNRLKLFIEGKLIQYMGAQHDGVDNLEPLFKVINKYLDEAGQIQLRINALERMAEHAKKSNDK
tara:strand:+ start:380 stop:628 length:249 start_codon:yes stop_codon:yes gene_type:complete